MKWWVYANHEDCYYIIDYKNDWFSMCIFDWDIDTIYLCWCISSYNFSIELALSISVVICRCCVVCQCCIPHPHIKIVGRTITK
jgi:hypothetical protein